LQDQDLQGLNEALLLARQLDASYPNVYYVAGLLAEFSGDFKDAQACYQEAARLSGGQPLAQAQQQIPIDQIAAAAYLQSLAEAQQGEGLGLFKALKGR
jgi:tetratricopeptide (TPR) repeat protein